MQSAAPQKLSMVQVLACGAAIVTLSMGIRHGFGLWLQPITQAQGWTRETFAFALAIQNLAWGCFGIFAGMAGRPLRRLPRAGRRRPALRARAWPAWRCRRTPWLFTLTAGVLIGAAQAGTTYAVIYGVIGRQIDPAKRSWAMGVAAAAGSFGQFLMVPVEGFLICGFGWQEALLVLSLCRAADRAAGLRPARARLRRRHGAQARADHRRRRCAKPSSTRASSC